LSLRRAVIALASGLLLLVLLGGDGLGRVPGRARVLGRSASLDGTVRRLHGTAVAFDRQFYVFLESVRRALPPATAGVAILGAPASDAALYLAAYDLAPVPVLLAPDRVPPGWVLAVYGPERPPGWTTIASVWKGALMAPAP
jgi:hypothetical protein